MVQQNVSNENSHKTTFSGGYTVMFTDLADGTIYFELRKNNQFVDGGVADDKVQAVRESSEMYFSYWLGEQTTASERRLFDSLAGLE